MTRLTPLVRISAGLVLVTCSILIMLDMLGLTPSPADAKLESRIRLCETLAAHAASAAQRNDFGAIRAALEVTVRQDEDVLSGGLRDASGRLLVATQTHRQLWEPDPERRPRSTHVRVPLFKGGAPWATIEVRFRELGAAEALGALWERPVVRLSGLVALVGFVAYTIYMRRTLRHLDPSAVIPTRVKAALDVMAEGVVLLDEQQRIVLANEAFAEKVGRGRSSLVALDLSRLAWRVADGSDDRGAFPWVRTLEDAEVVSGVSLQLGSDAEGARSFIVTAAPVLDGSGRAKGAIVTFDDVTELERKKAELEKANHELKMQKEELQLREQELKILAECDPLTGISNRRHFLESIEGEFARAQSTGWPLACMMLDIDHFKRVNDTHGHQVGDEVIKRVAQVLKSELRSTDIICRYGGEEFCVVMAGVDPKEAFVVADRLRRRVAAPAFARVPVTSSFGVSSTLFGAESVHELLKQADDALYVSKAAGRNRVTRWDQRETAKTEQAETA